MRNPDLLVGRDEELASLRRFTEAPGDGGAVVVLEGPAGIGKTTIWEAGLAVARDGGYRVLSSRAATPELQLSLDGLSDLLEGVHDEALAPLPEPQRRALAVALVLEEGEGAPDRRALSLAFLGALRSLAVQGPLLVAIDDVQWLDGGTAALLGFAAGRLRDAPVRFLLARRSGGGEQAWTRGAEQIEVGPLSLGALSVVLRRVLDEPLSRPLLRRIHEAAEGNPFFALELARALQRRGLVSTAQAELPVPQTLRSLVQERLEGLPDEVRDALLAAAITPEPTQALLDATFGRPVELRSALEAGVAIRDGDRLRLAHPLLAASLVEEASPEHLRELHALLAEAVDDREARVRHLAAAATPPDVLVAAELDETVESVRRRDVRAAAELAQRALELSDPDDQDSRARRASLAGWLHCEAGDGVRGGELMRLGIELLPPGPERAKAILTLLRSAARIDKPVDLGLEALDQADDDFTRGTLQLALSEIQLVRGELRAGLEHVRQAAALTATLGEPRLHRAALGRRANLEWLLGAGDAEATLAAAERIDAEFTDSDPTDTIFSPRHVRARTLLWRDELADARRLFEALDAFALESQADAWRPNGLLHLVRLELRAGRFELARRYAGEAAEIGEASGLTQLYGAVFAMRGLIEAHAGNLDEARALAAESDRIATSVEDRWHGLYNRATLGLAEVSAGRYEDALAAVGGMADELDAIGVVEPGVFLFERDALEAYAALGNEAEAEALAERLERRGTALRRPRALATAARGRALLLAGRGEADGALAELDRVAELEQEFIDPLDSARTLLLRGTVERRARRFRAARDHLTEALDRFERLGSAAFAERAREEVGRLGGRRTASGLTPTEQRVAALAAEGLTNRQIASSLVVTVSTVEAHLTRIYAKLGVRSRAQLARELQT